MKKILSFAAHNLHFVVAFAPEQLDIAGFALDFVAFAAAAAALLSDAVDY